MSSSSFQPAAPGSWQWPDDLPQPFSRRTAPQPAHESGSPAAGIDGAAGTARNGSQSQSQGESTQERQRHWKPRTCRICLETVLPTFTTPTEGYFTSGPKVVYESEDGGRLLRPCKCKGTSKYVHEGCLQAWRHADPSYGQRNFFQCPTCGYKYRLQRLGWGRLVTSVSAQISLTILIMLTVVFLLGFIADPIINFALDPYGTILPGLMFPGFSFQVFSFGYPGVYYDAPRPPVRPPGHLHEPTGWIEHFAKGFAGLGLMSFLKFMLSSPINFFLRQGGVGGRQTGRDRLNTMTWIMIAVGVATFLYAVWKGVRNLSRRTLERAGERVMEVQGEDDDDDDDDGGDGRQNT